MGTLRKFIRSTKLYKNSKLSLGALSLATILSTALYPGYAGAVGIIRTDGGVMESNGNTHNIYASEVRGSVGMNRFGKFDLEQNNIANMYFHTKNGTDEANHLLNFVSDKININGTVNAIQNSKLGGNLYFLSQQGLVVGKTGVINAGTFNVMTKNKNYASNSELYNDFYDIVNMKEDLDRLNDEGKIEVYGKINTVDGIRLKAGTVIIGDAQSRGITALKSGVVNFADVVNIKAGSTTIQSGLSGEQLKATRANNGDIVLGENYESKEGFKNGAIQLRAYADTRNAFDKNYNPAATSITGNNVVKAEVQVNEGASISSYSNVDITAETSYGKGLSGLFGTDIASANVMDLLGKSAKAEALITVNGNVKAGVNAANGGKGSVNINAKTNNVFVSGAKTNVSKDLMRAGSKKFLDWLFGSSSVSGMGDIIYADIQSHAVINVGEKANIQALNDINIETNSKIKSSAGAKHQVEDYYLSEYENKKDNWKEFISKYGGQAGIAVNNTTNMSKINVAGKLTAGEVDGKKGAGDVKLNAKSDTLQLTNVKVSQKKSDKDEPPAGNGIRIGFAYSDMQNTTDVTVSGEVKANNGKITVDSSGASSITTSVSTNSGDGGTMATTAIDINEITTNSSVNITGQLNADKGMDISSTNETDMCTSAEISATWDSETAEAVYGEGSSAEYAGLANLFDGIARDDKGKVMGQYSKMLAAGIALNWHDVDVSSTINVGAGAELKVSKNATSLDENGKAQPAELNVSATSSITDMNLQASGSATKGKKAEDEDTKLISGAVLVANVNNNATVNIAGNKGDKKAPLISAPVVNINGEATNEWDRVNSMWDFVNTQWEIAMSDLKDNLELVKLLNNAKNKLLAYQKDNSEKNFHEMMGAVSDLQKIPTMSTYKALNKLNQKILDDTISALFDFLCLSNYANTYVASSATSEGDKQAKFALSGAVAVNNFSNKANVIVGRGAQIEATNGDVDISSKSSQNLIHAAGALYEYNSKEEIEKPTSDNKVAKFFIDYLHDKFPSISAFPTMWAGNDAKNLIGGNVIVTNNNSQALTLIAEGAQISGDSISISADNRLANTNIVLAGGSAGSLGITGMGSYDGGSSDSIVSVDDEAKLTADAELAIDAKNDNILTSIVGNLSASGNMGIGASLGLVNYDINTLSAVADNDSNTLNNKNKLAELLRKKLSDKQRSYLGTAESSIGRGSLSAGETISVTAKDTGIINTLTVAGIAVGGGASDKQGQGDAGSGGVLDKLNVALAGSVSVNTINGTTLAAIDGSDVNGDGSADVSVSANEDKYIGAYSGAAAIKTMGAAGTDKPAATLSGSVGVNKGSQSVKSSLKNTKLSSINSVDNRAVKQGTNVAVGLAYGQTAVSSGKLGVQVVGSGSGISMKNTVEAAMDGVDISAKGAVKNIAQSKDIQVAGGVSASYARNAKVGVGASVAYLDADNTLNAKINKSKISSNSLESLAVSKTTQVGGAVTAGVMTGDGVKVGVNGAVVINTLTNTNEASITGSTINTKDLRVRAYDGNLVEISASGQDVTDASDNTWLKKLKDQGYNVDGVESVAGEGSAKADGNGNKIISAAVGIGFTPATLEQGVNVSAGVAVGVNKINNNFTAKIDNSSVNANKKDGKVAIEAKSNASLLNVGAVATITLGQSNNVGGGGNVAVNNIKNNVTASLSNAQDFHADSLTIRALDEKTIRNYAGTLNFAGGARNNATLGVSVGVNNLSGDTSVSVTNSKLQLASDAVIDAQSKNKINNVIITAGMSMSGEGIALSGAGTVAANNISGNTKASMSVSDVQSSGDLSISAADETDVESIVGNGVIALSGGEVAGAIGAGADKISYTRSTMAELIGKETNKNTINARNLKVKANSAQTIKSYAVGVGIAASGMGAGSVNGAVSTEKNLATTIAKVENITGTLSNIDVDAQHSNNLKRFNLGAAASGGVYSGSLGFSVGVLNDNSETSAQFNSNNIITAGDISINAANNNKLTSNVNTAAIAISLGGAIGANVVVDDFTSKVSVEANNNKIGDADHVAKSFKTTATNTMREESEQGVGSGALVAGGVGVGVFTTNTSVTNSMAKNTIYAHNITATADENRNFENQIINAGVGAGAITISALLNNVGAALDDKISYVVKQDDSTGKKENATADISAVLDNLDKSMVEQDSYLTDKGLQGALGEAGLSEKDVKNDMHISRGTTSSEGVQVISKSNKLSSDGKVNLAAHATTYMNEKNDQGSLAGASINIAVSKTKVNNKVGVTVDGTTIDAITKTEGGKTSISARPDIDISSTVDGEIQNAGRQGSAAIVGINTVYTGSWINNENKVTIRNAASLVGRNLSISAQDALHNIVQTHGYSSGGAVGGALYATAQSKSQNLIEITGSNLFAGMSADNSIFASNGELNIKAEKSNKVWSTITAGAVAAASARGMVATAIDGEENATDEKASVSTVSIAGSNLKAGKAITATASKLLNIQSKIDSWDAGIGISANGAISHAYATGAANMLSGDGNSYASGDKLTLEALVDKRANSDHSISADMTANNGGLVGVSVNEAMTVYNVLANTQANKALYKAKDMTIKANHNVDVFNKAKGLEVGVGIASGTMAAHVTTNAKTHIDAKGAKYDDSDEKKSSDLGDVDISANTLVKEDIYAQGDGGGVFDISPVAAKIVNKLMTDTVTNILGNWKLSGDFTADALNQDDVTQTVKSLKVGVVGGYGGVQNYDVTQHNAKVNVGSAGAPATIITTDGVQLYQAGNIVKHHADTESSGGGLLKGSGGDLATRYDGEATKFTSSVTFDNAQLTSEEADSESKGYTTDAVEASSIKAQSFTEADLQYDNKLNAVGVLYSGVWNKSDHDITYDNSVNVKGNSKLTTMDRKQDITLAAYDKSTVKFNTIADSGYGLAASAYGRTYASFARNAKINIEKGSELNSAYNTYINAGGDLNGINSSLNYTVNSEAYNRSLIPAGTSGKFENNMVQNNQANIAGDITSVHNVYLNATGGSDTVKQISKEYLLYTGTQTDEEVTTVLPGTIDKKQNTNNYVNVTGKVTAGTHNGLDIDISGGISVTQPDYEDGKVISPGSLSYNGIKIDIKEGSDWFDESSIKAGEVEVKNALLESYLKLQNAMAGYDSQSAEYKALEKEMTTLFNEMKANGFVVENKNSAGETVAVILDSRYMPSIEVPDIYVSGGNIHITADKLQGSGELTAKGVNDLKLTNRSNTNMVINDVVIEEAGGRVTFNGQTADENHKHGFDGKIHADAKVGTVPTITISSTGNADDNIKNYTNADLTILGRLQNIEGKINISNEHRNINISGDSAISAQQIEIKADHGSVTQNSNGFFSIGSDPISRYQFSKSIADKIQKYVAELIKNNQQSTFKADTYLDYCQYLLDNAKEIGLTRYEMEEIGQAYANYKKLANGEVANGIVAGNNIYINARNLNIDGLVQSGYDKYNVEYTEGMRSRINELDKKYSSIANKDALTNSDVLGNPEFLINYKDGKAAGGATYDSAGKKYTYEIKLYYNPATKEIISEKIETNGGKIYLTGAISSTGNGRLLAMNGTADVDIDLSKATGANERDLNVSSIKINDVAGLISIRDTSAKRQTSYTVEGDKVRRTTYNIDDRGNIYNGRTELVNKNGLVYSPVKGTTISWTGGITGAQTVTTMHYDKKFVLWGLIKYSSTKDFIDQVQKEHGKIDSTTTTTADGSALNSGVYVGVKGSNTGFSVDGQRYNTSESYSSVSEDKIWDTWGKIFGYGTMKYSWTKYEGSSTSSTYTISADKNIGVGFMDGGTGNISIKNTGNLNVAGWLQNSSKTTTSDGVTKTTGVGAINLTSNNGDIYAWDGARLATDNLTADAKGSLFIYGHRAIGDNAKVSLGAETGHINFSSEKGNLEMSGAGAANGMYLLDAAGDVTTAKNANGYTDAKIIGGRVDITSAGKVDVRVDTGTDMSSGFLNDGLNIDAQGDIKVYHNENNKDLLVGEIISHNGNVSMETTNSFVDAIDDNTLSDADERIKHWQDMGIISAGDSAGSKEKSAKAQKDAALADANAKLGFLAKSKAKVTEYQKAAEGLENAVNDYRSALKKAQTDEARAKALEAYNSAKAAYFNGLSQKYSTDEQNAIANYAEVNFSTDYGWSANQLLYAIQRDVINSTPGQTVLGDTANITGHKITLKAGKGIGVDAAAETIAKDKLGELDSLKKLSQAKSGDLTWHEDGSVTIAKQQPLLINVVDKINPDGTIVEKGTVVLDATNNVYIAGIKDTQLNINGSIDTKGDIKLMADKGITTSERAVLSGRNLTLYGGAGDVGSLDNMINISKITGSLNANTDRDHGVYIKKIADKDGEQTKLTIEGITTGDLVLESETGMDWSKLLGKSQGYLDAKTISLTATNGSDIGAADSAVRILNNDAVINASGTNIYLQGINEAGRVGGLTATRLFVDNKLVFNSEGNIKLAERKNANGSISVGKIAKRTFDVSGHVNYSAANDVTLNSTGGTITQSKYHQILADKLTATAQGDVLLEGGVNASVKGYNELKDVTLGSESGKIVLANGGSKALDISITKVGANGLAQSIDLHNYKHGDANKMNVKGDVQAKGDINVVQEESGDLKTAGNITSNEGNIYLEAAKDLVTSGDSITAQKGNITLAANAGSLTNSSKLIAENGYVAAIANGSMYHDSELIKASGVAFISKNDIDFNQAHQSIITVGDGSVALISTEGSVNIWNDININAKGDVWLQGHNNVTVAREGTGTLGNISSENGDITLVADTGFVDNIGSITANNGKVTLKAVGSYVDSNGKTVLGTVANDGSITARSISIEAAGDIRTDLWTHGAQKSTLSATDDKLEIISRQGSVTLTDDTTLLANNDIIIQAEKDVINNMKRQENTGGLYTEKGDIFITANNGDIINNNDLITGAGSIFLNSLAGTIDNNGSIDAAKSASLIAYKDLNISKDDGTGTVEILARGEGGLTFASEAGSVSFGDGVLVASNDSINITAEQDIVNNNKTAGSHDSTHWTGLVAANDINMTANKGKIDNNASLWAATGNIKMNAISGSLENTGKLTVGKNITMQAASSITNGFIDASQPISADLVAGGRVTMLAAKDSITSNGDITALGEVSLKAKNDIISVGDITAKGELTMIAEEGGLSSEGNLTAGKDAADTADLILSAKEDIITEGNIESETGDVSLTSQTANVLSTGSIIAARDVSISADESIITDSLTYDDKLAGRNISLIAANGEIINENSMEAEENITLTAATDVENNGKLIAHNGSVDIEATNGRLDNTGSLQAGQDINMTADLDLTNIAAALSAGNNISLRAKNGALVNDANATATNGYINFWAEDAVINGNDGSDGSTESAANLVAGKFVSLISDTASVTNYGDIDAQAGDITINGATSVSSTGALTAAEDIVLTADAGALSNYGDLSSTNGDIVLDAQDDVEVVASLIKAENGSVDISSDAGSIELNKAATIGVVKAQDIYMSAETSITNNSDITASAGDITLDAGTALTNEGALDAAFCDINLDAGTALINNGALTAAMGDISLVTVGGGLKNNGEITATQGDANLNAGVGALANNAKIIVGQDIYMKSLSTITNSGELNAGADVTLDAMGKLTNSGAVNVGGNITFDTTNAIENIGSLAADGNILLDGFMGVTNKNSLGSNKGGVTLISDNSDIKNEGAIAAKENIELTAGEVLTNSGNITSNNGGIELTAENGELSNSGMLYAKNNILLSAEKAALSNSGLINSRANVLLKAATELNNQKAVMADGIVALLADKNITNSGALLSNNEDIYVLTAGDITNTAAVRAVNGDISFNGNNITQSGALVAGSTTDGVTTLGVVNIVASGNVTNSGAVTATGDISFEGTELSNNAGGTLNAGGDVSLNASEGLTNNADVSAGYDVVFTAGKTITNKRAVTAGDDILFTAGEDISNASALTAADDIIFIAGKDITNTSAASITTNGDVQFIANKKISNKSNITAESIKLDAGTDIDNAGNALQAQADITLTAGGNVTNDASLSSERGDIGVSGKKIEQKLAVNAKNGEVTITAGDTLTTSGSIHGRLGVKLTANNKLTTKNGDITAGFEVKDETGKKIFEYGDVTLESLHNTVEYEGNITGVNVTIGAAKDITIAGTHKIKATGTLDENAALTIVSTGGSVTLSNTSGLDADNDLTIIANKNLTNNAGDLTAGQDISLISITGDIDNNGNIKAEHGDVLLYAEKGAVDNDANITAKNITLDAYEDLSVDFFSNHKLTATGAEAGDKLELISRNGDVLIWQNTNFEAGRDIIITAKKDVWNGMSQGSQEGHDLVAKNGSITIMAEDGSFYNDADIKAKENIGIYAGDKIDSEGTINAYGTNKNEGNIFFQANNDIRQVDGPVLGENNVVLASLVGSVTLTDNISSVNGSVAIVANGDIIAKSIKEALLEIKAKDGAYLISNNGSIKADKVSADEIIYAANSNEHKDASGNTVKSEIHVKQTHVGSVLDITGNNVYLHDTAKPDSVIQDPNDCFTEHGIWQTGAKDTLYLKLSTAKNSAGQYVPAENLVLNFHKLNDRLDIDKLWVKNIELNVPVDELLIHKLAVEGRADIATNKMASTIYGQPPQRTDADTIFWQDYAHRNPGLSEALWHSWNDDADNSWMNLFFHRDGVRQTSNNSALLHKRDYRYAYNQRYSAEDWLLYRTLFDESGHRGDITLVPLYERYNLLDYADSEDEEAAAIKVE